MLCHIKIQCLDFLTKVDNLASLLLDCCEKLFLNKIPSPIKGGVPHVD